ncbi:MAG TPA: hypothetical protein VNG32_04165 [Candidatus Dormibacteraeota bacterium]|nr:hypothetical protein [Candidatus Dormibacteraeota bacterium]
MRKFDSLAAVGAVSSVLLAGAAQAQAQPIAFADCNPIGRQQFIDQRIITDTSFPSGVLKPHNPETTTIVVRERDQPANSITNPGAITCGKHIVDYFGLKVEYVGNETDISTALLPAADAEVSQWVGNHETPVKNPERAGLLVRRTLRFQYDDVYGPLGFSDGNVTYGLMP